MVFFDVANFVDPCQWVEFDPPVSPTVDDLTSALASVPDFNATATTDVTVDGFHGKQIEFTSRQDRADIEEILSSLQIG